MLNLTAQDIADAESELAAMTLEKEAARQVLAATPEHKTHAKLQSAVWRYEEWLKALKARLAEQGEPAVEANSEAAS